jgi:hypothetical protein
MTNKDQKLADLNENGKTYEAAERATTTFRKQLLDNVEKLGKEGYPVEILAKESGLPVSVVTKIVAR